jgi:hypothetical protein
MMLFWITAIPIMIMGQDPLFVANVITNMDPIGSMLDLNHLAISCDDLFAVITLEN